MLSVNRIKQKLELSELARLLPERSVDNEALQEAVFEIVQKVKVSGDAALLEYTARFDGVQLTQAEIKVGPEEFKEAGQLVGKDFKEAIRLATQRIRTFHQRQRPSSWTFWDKNSELGQLVRPVERAGVYVPGGRAAYPSSVLMNVIPAQIAGVTEIAMCVPPASDGKINPYTLFTAGEVGIEEIYKAGGAQAIAALAYGTETIRKVDKITGPGNIYVTLAKKMVVGLVDIDMLAGPSEVVIIADEKARADFIAADMLAQAEHDPQAMAVLITTTEKKAKEVCQALTEQLKALRQPETARESLENNGRIFVMDSVSDAIELANQIAPEHLELMIEEPRTAVDKIKNAGSIFLGAFTPEVVGDYLAGPNHVLPTGGTARFYSPLSVDDFVKKTSLIGFSRKDLSELATAIQTIAQAEKLEAHARAVLIRKESDE